MNLRTFVCGTSLLLVAWLALSFWHKSTPNPYPSPTLADSSPQADSEEPLAWVNSSSR